MQAFIFCKPSNQAKPRIRIERWPLREPIGEAEARMSASSKTNASRLKNNGVDSKHFKFLDKDSDNFEGRWI